MHANQQELDFNDVGERLVLLGLFGLIDPRRAQAIAAVAGCRTAGIRSKTITGDYVDTACEVGVYARQSGEQAAARHSERRSRWASIEDSCAGWIRRFHA